MCMHQIELMTRDAGYELLKKNEIPGGTVTSPDLVVRFKASIEPSVTYILAPDFYADSLGKGDILTLAEAYSHGDLPDASSTRWLAAILTHGSSENLIWNKPKNIHIPTMGDIEIQYTGKQRQADPALGIYISPQRPGQRSYWDASLFSIDSSIDSRSTASEWLDLTGANKAIADNPHMPILRGVWGIEWLVEIDPENGLADLHFCWGEGSENLECMQPGIYTFHQEALVEETTVLAARIATARPHFQGRARLRGAIVTYKGDFDMDGSSLNT